MTNILELPTDNVARESAADFNLPEPGHGRASVPADGNCQSDPDSGAFQSNNPKIHSSTDPSAPLADPLDHLELQLEHAQPMANDSPDVFLKAAMTIASVDFFTVLNRFDTDALIKRLHERPQLYFQLINSFANLMKVSLDQQKFELKQKQAEARQRDRDQKLRACKPILLTDDTLTSLARTLAGSRRREEADAPLPMSPPSTIRDPASIHRPRIQHPSSNTGNPFFSHSSNNPPIHSSSDRASVPASQRTTETSLSAIAAEKVEPVTTASPPSANPSPQQSNNPQFHDPIVHHPPTNTTNTGFSEFVEFNAFDPITEPETEPVHSPTYDEASCRDSVEQHSDDLVCSPL